MPQGSSEEIDAGAHDAVGSRRGSIYAPVRQIYFAQALASHASSLLMTGIFFYTQRQFHWGLRQNLLMASGAGAFYVCGALSASRVSGRFGRRNTALCLQGILLTLVLIALAMPRPIVVVCVLLLYNGLSAATWPAFQSLVSDGASGTLLAKRLAMYNLVWSGTNAVTLAASGSIIEFWPNGLFALAAVAHVLTAVFVKSAGLGVIAPSSPAGFDAAQGAGAAPEPQLLRMRTEALWLSRIALPSTYVVVYSLSAMLPSLAVMQPLNTRWRTVIGSVWFASRWSTFLVLGSTTFWHTRPRLMLGATVMMLAAFLGTTLRPGDLFSGAGVSGTVDVMSMVAWQVLLGASMGIIYSASLYFGMVLSDGSTQHGGYHEALIGMGCVLGPGSAALAQILYPGRLSIGIATVAGLIALSAAAAGAAAAIAAGRSRRSLPLDGLGV